MRVNTKLHENTEKFYFVGSDTTANSRIKLMNSNMQGQAQGQIKDVTQSRPTLCSLMDCSPPGFSVHRIFSGKNTGAGCHALLQVIFQTSGSNLHLLCLLYWQADSLPLVPLNMTQEDDRGRYLKSKCSKRKELSSRTTANKNLRREHVHWRTMKKNRLK